MFATLNRSSSRVLCTKILSNSQYNTSRFFSNVNHRPTTFFVNSLSTITPLSTKNYNNNNINGIILSDKYTSLLQQRIIKQTNYCTTSTTSTTTNNTTSTTIEQPNINKEEIKQDTTPKKKTSPFAFMRKGYFNLVKFPISIYVTFTTVAGYVMTAPIVDPWTLSLISLGTFLSSASASAYNQEMEVSFDAKMPRTKSRPLVTGEIKRDTGFNVAMGLSVLGCCILVPVNPVCGALAMSNILLYILYTQMKRTTPLNTWVGAFVGAIPPLIGTVGGAGCFEPIGGFLATVLYIWQIPHFLALAEKLKSQYAMAGYKMLPVTHPHLNYPMSLWHAVAGAIIPFAFLGYYDLNMTTTTVAFFSLSSAVMALESVLEQRHRLKIEDAKSKGYQLPPQMPRNRGVFFLSLIMLPLSLIIGMIFRLPYEYYYEDEKEDQKLISN